jgi:streptomycin 3"-adenylyltransferase
VSETQGTAHAAIPEPLDRILPAFVGDLRSTLGSDLVGVYLYGSAVMGGFDRDRSDLDLVVVIEPSVDDVGFGVFAALIDRLKAREPDWAGRLDIVFVARRTLAEFRSGGSFVEVSHPHPLKVVENAAEYVETWFLMRTADRPIVGPPAPGLVPPISTREFLFEVVAGIDGFIAAVRDDTAAGTAAYRAITVCRVLRSLESGSICTKQEGTEWAAQHYPEWAELIRAAWAVQSSNGRRDFAPDVRARIQPFLVFMGQEIHRAAISTAG